MLLSRHEARYCLSFLFFDLEAACQEDIQIQRIARAGRTPANKQLIWLEGLTIKEANHIAKVQGQQTPLEITKKSKEPALEKIAKIVDKVDKIQIIAVIERERDKKIEILEWTQIHSGIVVLEGSDAASVGQEIGQTECQTCKGKRVLVLRKYEVPYLE